MDLLVVGAGDVGRWVARTVDAAVAVTDVDEAVAREAAAETGASAVPVEGEERFDAVCVAVPMGAVESALETQAPRATEALLDVTGVMARPVRTMRRVAPDRERLSLHPLFAPERAPGRVAAVRDEPGPVTDAICEQLSATGNTVVDTTPEEHDEAMETVQATTHAAILAFALAAEPAPDGLETPTYRDLATLAERVASGTPRVYTDIQETFDGAEGVAEAARTVAEADEDELTALLEEADAAWRGEPG